MKNLPKWVKAIPESQAHGSGTLQKRLWRLVSDYVRIRDFHAYGGVCIATGVKIGHWSQGDAGHWKSYSICRGLFKFDPINIHLQSKTSNGWGGQEIGHAYGENLKKRYYNGILDVINDANKLQSLKFSEIQVLDETERIINLMGALKQKPSYYSRVVELQSLSQ